MSLFSPGDSETKVEDKSGVSLQPSSEAEEAAWMSETFQLNKKKNPVAVTQIPDKIK